MSEVVQNDVLLCRPTCVVSRYVTVANSMLAIVSRISGVPGTCEQGAAFTKGPVPITGMPSQGDVDARRGNW